MNDLKRKMPLLARHEGVWDGWYRHVDPRGNRIDEHRSRLVCRFPTSGPFPYHQTNHYTWEDGRTEQREFSGEWRDGRLRFSSELITGWAAEVTEDSDGRTILLHWMRTAQPDLYLYEMIQLSDCGRYRCRTWQWIKGGRIHLRTLIDEEKVSDSWAGF